MANLMKKLAFLAVLSLLGSCSTSPTGRNQVLLFNGAEMDALGAQSFSEMKQKEKVLEDPVVNAYVACVANAVTAEVPAEFGVSHWEVVVFDSEQVNAFALPGGHIGVYTGLLKVAETPDQLSSVIGHEIAHVLAQHSNERLSRSQIAGVTTTVAAIAIGASDVEHKGAAMAALGLGVQFGVMLPYGRAQESEADIMGLDLMAQAGFDPKQSVTLWQNMAAAGGSGVPELLSTHPSHDTRISDLQGRMDYATKLQMQAVAQNKQPKCQLPPVSKPPKQVKK